MLPSGCRFYMEAQRKFCLFIFLWLAQHGRPTESYGLYWVWPFSDYFLTFQFSFCGFFRDIDKRSCQQILVRTPQMSRVCRSPVSLATSLKLNLHSHPCRLAIRCQLWSRWSRQRPAERGRLRCVFEMRHAQSDPGRAPVS